MHISTQHAPVHTQLHVDSIAGSIAFTLYTESLWIETDRQQVVVQVRAKRRDSIPVHMAVYFKTDRTSSIPSARVIMLLECWLDKGRVEIIT